MTSKETKKSILGLPLISEEKFQLVKTHYYVGDNKSILYNYVLNHMCNWIVDKFPLWLAPNLITFIGFLVNLIPSVLVIAIYGYDLFGNLDAWFCYVIGVTYTFYIIMDNCDGKQARRTKTSSPMGMIFDHQCDAIVAVINNLLLQRMFQLGNDEHSLFYMAICTLPFYFVLVEQYYTDEMNFPPINGVDEGSLLYLVMSIMTGIKGSDNLWLGKFSLFGV